MRLLHLRQNKETWRQNQVCMWSATRRKGGPETRKAKDTIAVLKIWGIVWGKTRQGSLTITQKIGLQDTTSRRIRTSL